MNYPKLPQTVIDKVRTAKENVSPVRFFVIVASVFGLLFLFLTPPFQGSDEPLHFYRTYQISEGNIIVDSNEGNDYGGVIPASLKQTVDLTTNSWLGNLKPDEKYDIRKTKQALSIEERRSERTWTNFTATAVYPPIAYIPQTVGVWVARILHAPPIAMMYAGRLANLATWVLLLALAIRLMPRKKWALVFVGLLPVAISQAASLSADVMTIGLFAVFISGVFYFSARKKRITNLELSVLFGVMVAMTLCKQVMVLMLPLILLIPNALFGPKKRAYLIKAGLIFASALVYLAWLYVVKDVDMKSVFSRGQDPEAQILFMLQNPFKFLEALWNTHFFMLGDNITRSFIGTFGWGDTGISEFFVTVGYIGLFLVLVINPYKRAFEWITGRQKLLVAFLGLVYAVAVSAAMYLYYNPVGAKTIAGIQGRYLMPIAYLAIPLFQGNWLKTSKTVYRGIAIGVPLLLLVASVIAIYSRYYVRIA